MMVKHGTRLVFRGIGIENPVIWGRSLISVCSNFVMQFDHGVLGLRANPPLVWGVWDRTNDSETHVLVCITSRLLHISIDSGDLCGRME